MKKEFKMKKTLALVMALSVAATSAANFSALAVEGSEGWDTKVTLKKGEFSADYILKYPSSVDLIEKASCPENSEKFVYKATNGDNDYITVSDSIGVDTVVIKLTNANPSDNYDNPIVGDFYGEYRKITVFLDEKPLNVGSSVTFEGIQDQKVEKNLKIETDEVDTPVSADLKGELTFTVSATLSS